MSLNHGEPIAGTRARRDSDHTFPSRQKRGVRCATLEQRSEPIEDLQVQFKQNSSIAYSAFAPQYQTTKLREQTAHLVPIPSAFSHREGGNSASL
jgi:hypothetical protein